MLISLCTPVMNRAADLKRTMPMRLAAAKASPPVEFVIVDYGSRDDLQEFVFNLTPPEGVWVTCRKYPAEHYHQAHAYNLAILAGSGEYFCLMGADTYPKPEYFPTVRTLIAGGAVWIEDPRYKGAICCRKKAFVDVGGYDERFEFYGPEDRDLADRLERRGYRKTCLPEGMLGNFYTPDVLKMANYRLPLSKEASSERMRKIYTENQRNHVTVVNREGWGRWT